MFPWLGNQNINEITAPQLLAVLRRIKSRGIIETAHRAKQNCGQVFRYAVATGRAERDPSADLRGALPPTKTKHLASIKDPGEVGALMRAIDGYKGTVVAMTALNLSPLVFLRPGELRQGLWAEIKLDSESGAYRASARRKCRTTPYTSCHCPNRLSLYSPSCSRNCSQPLYFSERSLHQSPH